jgi:hypothetical protein
LSLAIIENIKRKPGISLVRSEKCRYLIISYYRVELGIELLLKCSDVIYTGDILFVGDILNVPTLGKGPLKCDYRGPTIIAYRISKYS